VAPEFVFLFLLDSFEELAELASEFLLYFLHNGGELMNIFLGVELEDLLKGRNLIILLSFCVLLDFF